jgi:hypothetical protein
MAKVSTHQLKPLELSAMDVGCSSDNEICKDISTATTISTLTTDASEEQEQGGLHLDFKCFYCSQVCSSNNDRVQHIDNEHPGNLYYPTPEDFENRLNRYSLPVYYGDKYIKYVIDMP